MVNKQGSLLIIILNLHCKFYGDTPKKVFERMIKITSHLFLRAKLWMISVRHLTWSLKHAKAFPNPGTNQHAVCCSPFTADTFHHTFSIHLTFLAIHKQTVTLLAACTGHVYDPRRLTFWFLLAVPSIETRGGSGFRTWCQHLSKFDGSYSPPLSYIYNWELK